MLISFAYENLIAKITEIAYKEKNYISENNCGIFFDWINFLVILDHSFANEAYLSSGS